MDFSGKYILQTDLEMISGVGYDYHGFLVQTLTKLHCSVIEGDYEKKNFFCMDKKPVTQCMDLASLF